MLHWWGMEGAGCFHWTGLVLSREKLRWCHDGGNEFKTKSISFTCGMWIIDLGDGVYEDPVVFRCSIATDYSNWWRWCRHLKNSQILLRTWRSFNAVRFFFSNFKIRYIPKAQNTMTDKLARGMKSSSSAMLYVDSLPSIWLFNSAVSLFSSFCCQKKKKLVTS